MRPVYLFKLKFKVPYGLRIGSGEKGGNELEPLEDGEGRYLIPESSWKGVFRRVTEMLYGNKEHFTGHTEGGDDVYDKEKIEKCRREGECDEVTRIYISKVNKEDPKTFKIIYNMWNCPIERLYGSGYFAGAITISDTVLTSRVIDRPHVTIDRKTKKSKEHNLFTEKVVYPEVIEVKVIVRDEIQAWMRTLKFLYDVGYFIGGGKSRGIGYIRLYAEESEMARVEELGQKPVFRPVIDELKSFATSSLNV